MSNTGGRYFIEPVGIYPELANKSEIFLRSFLEILAEAGQVAVWADKTLRRIYKLNFKIFSNKIEQN